MLHSSIFVENNTTMAYKEDGSTRNENGLLDKMRKLFNSEKLTTWEYVAFKKMVRSFAKENNFYFDEEKEMLYKRNEQLVCDACGKQKPTTNGLEDCVCKNGYMWVKQTNCC